MSRKGSYSPEQRQEDVSLQQLQALLNAHGWPAERMVRDLGEDILVRICDNGSPSGLSFFAQVKSIRNLDARQAGKGMVKYRLGVHHLLQWETGYVPVLVVLWDVASARGCWVSVVDAIADLDSISLAWRSQVTVTVHLPLANGTDNAGLELLRRRIADLCFPAIARGRACEIKASFVFPKTTEGQAALAAIEEHFRTGEAVRIDGAFIERLELPDWWTRIYPPASGRVAHLQMGPPASAEPLRVKVEVFPDGGEPASVDYLVLRLVRAGI